MRWPADEEGEKMNKIISCIFFGLIVFAFTGCDKKAVRLEPAGEAVESKEEPVVEKTEKVIKKEAPKINKESLLDSIGGIEKPGTYAVIKVTHGGEQLGYIVLRLFPDKTPITVSNFIGLADGTREFVDPKTGVKTKRRFYDGLIFHRVMPNFMIQGGDPQGTGRGGPGYRFEDEFVQALTFDRVGLLAMANSGPNTNGSQFFITVAKTPWLNGKHTIFGEVVKGQEVVNKIAGLPAGTGSKPHEPVVMEKVVIEIKH